MAERQRIVVLGAAGQARDTVWLLEEINRSAPTYDFVGFVVSDASRLGPNDSADQVLGDYAWLEAHRDGFDAFAIGIGTPAVRLKVAAELSEAFPHATWPTLIHPSVILDFDSARIGRGVAVCAGVVGTVNVVLEDFSLVNPACTLGHEAHVGRGCVLNHGASLAGAVELGESTLVGSRACILQYLTVGPGSTVGAGAVVTRDVPAGTTVVGVPARPLVRRQA